MYKHSADVGGDFVCCLVYLVYEDKMKNFNILEKNTFQMTSISCMGRQGDPD